MAFMNARKRNKHLTYIIVALVSVGLLLSVSMYWVGNSSSVGYSRTGNSIENAAVRAFAEGSQLLQQGKVEEGTKKINEAIKGFEEVLKTDPQNVPSLGDLATAYYYLGQTDKAIETVKKALEINPNFSPARMNLAMYLYYGKNKAQEAIAELKKIPKGDTNYEQAQNYIAEFSKSPLPPGGNAVAPQENASEPQNNTAAPKDNAAAPQDNTAAPQQ